MGSLSEDWSLPRFRLRNGRAGAPEPATVDPQPCGHRHQGFLGHVAAGSVGEHLGSVREQALLVRRWFRDDAPLRQLASEADTGISIAYRSIEVVGSTLATLRSTLPLSSTSPNVARPRARLASDSAPRLLSRRLL